MSDERVVFEKGGATDEWPIEVQKAFVGVCLLAKSLGFSVLCAVGLNHKEQRMSAFFSPSSSENPHLAEMCEDIAVMFTTMARRLRQ